MLKFKSYFAIFLFVFVVVAFTPPIFQSEVNGQNTGQMTPASCENTQCNSCIVFLSSGLCVAQKLNGSVYFNSCVYGGSGNYCDQYGTQTTSCGQGDQWMCNAISGICNFYNCNCDSSNPSPSTVEKIGDCAT